MVGGEEKMEKTWKPKKKFYNVNVRVTTPIYNAMLRIHESGAYLNLSEYVGDLIWKDIEKRGIKLEVPKAFGEEEEGEKPAKELKASETATVLARVTLPIRDSIDQVLDSGVYLTVSDYLRYIIKRDLDSRGFEIAVDKEAIKKQRYSFSERRQKIDETVLLSTWLTMPVKDAIDQMLDSGPYLRVSDYLRDVIRKDLTERGLLPEPAE